MTVIQCCRCTVHSKKRRPPWTFAAVLPTLRFCHEFGLVFLWLRVFLKTCVLLVLHFF